MKTVFEVRKENLIKLILDKFQGNNTSFGKATGIHHNHVNLMATENPKTQRNMGEELARRIELAIGLPTGWIDVPHGDAAKSFVVKAMVMDASISRALITCRDYISLEVTCRWEMRMSSKMTSVDNLSLANVATSEMEPMITNGSNVIIDIGVKGFGSDGIYILTKGDAAFIRNVRRTMDGSYVLETANPAYRSDKPEQLKGMTVFGKLVMMVSENFL